MDLSVPCIVEGRSELRNAGRVNCKTHWPFRAAEHLTYWTNSSLCNLSFENCSALGWVCNSLHNNVSKIQKQVMPLCIRRSICLACTDAWCASARQFIPFAFNCKSIAIADWIRIGSAFALVVSPLQSRLASCKQLLLAKPHANT